MCRFAAGVLLIGAMVLDHVGATARSDSPTMHLGSGPMSCRWQTLQSQGFSDPVGKGVTLRFLGTVPGSPRPYYIYYWDFINPEGGHGRKLIIVLKYRCRYVGQYSIDAQPSKVSGDTIFFDTEKKFGNSIRFVNGRPPRRAWIDGEVHDFVR